MRHQVLVWWPHVSGARSTTSLPRPISNLAAVSEGEERRLFPSTFNDEFAVGPEEGNSAFFGLDVLRGLVAGIDDFIHLRQPRWRQSRSMGPALLGSAMWIDDAELIDKLGQLAGASIIITKQSRSQRQLRKLEPLHEVNERTPGLPIRAFASLSHLAPKVCGRPTVIGPYDSMYEGDVPTIRTLGYRRVKNFPPIMHAKLALLGHLWWHDEGPLGQVEDVIGFTAQRLWLSSANFTNSSRRNLEWGVWTEHPKVVDGAKRFLIEAMGSSEALDPDADHFDPDLAPFEFDDEAFREVVAEMDWDEAEDDRI